MIASSLLLFQNPVSGLQAVGFATTLLGVGTKLCIQDTVAVAEESETEGQKLVGRCNVVPDVDEETENASLKGETATADAEAGKSWEVLDDLEQRSMGQSSTTVP